MSFTEKQERLIKECVESKFGRRKFALNVLEQGWCSRRQEDAMINMLQRYKQNKSRANQIRYNYKQVKSYTGEIYLDMDELHDEGYPCGL